MSLDKNNIYIIYNFDEFINLIKDNTKKYQIYGDININQKFLKYLIKNKIDKYKKITINEINYNYSIITSLIYYYYFFFEYNKNVIKQYYIFRNKFNLQFNHLLNLHLLKNRIKEQNNIRKNINFLLKSLNIYTNEINKILKKKNISYFFETINIIQNYKNNALYQKIINESNKGIDIIIISDYKKYFDNLFNTIKIYKK